MEVKLVKGLNEDIVNLRTRVFVEEQKFKEEFDETDKTAIHAAVYDNDKIVGVGRLYYEDDPSHYHIGRVAVDKDYRKCGIGVLVMKELEKQAKKLGGEKISLSAQCQAQKFYEKNGYTASGEVYLDEHCPHILMSKCIL